MAGSELGPAHGEETIRLLAGPAAEEEDLHRAGPAGHPQDLQLLNGEGLAVVGAGGHNQTQIRTLVAGDGSQLIPAPEIK
jgi:hypothetical protein